MRAEFAEYYRPTAAEFDDLWRNGFFSFDANVLLSLYRVSEKTRSQLLVVLDKFKDRLWLSHQAAAEYHRHRSAEIIEYLDYYDRLSKDIEASVADLANKHARHPYIDLEHLWNRLREISREAIEEGRKKHPPLDKEDTLLARLSELFEGRVGAPFGDSALTSLFEDGKRRFEKQIPPGFRDTAKDGDRQYGDLVLWKQLIAEAKARGKPCVLVTEDRKEDWWHAVRGKTVGPRPELVAEMRKEAGVAFYMYRLEQFLSVAAERLPDEKAGLQKAAAEVKALDADRAALAERQREQLIVDRDVVRRRIEEFEQTLAAYEHRKKRVMDAYDAFRTDSSKDARAAFEQRVADLRAFEKVAGFHRQQLWRLRDEDHELAARLAQLTYVPVPADDDE